MYTLETTDPRNERKLSTSRKGLMLPWGSNLVTQLQVMGCFDPCHVALGEEDLLHLTMNHILKYFLLRFYIQTSFRQIIFTVFSITFDSIKQKCKTNIDSSVSYTSTFPPWEGLFCGLLHCLCLTLNFSTVNYDCMHTHTHSTRDLYFILPSGCLFMYFIDPHFRPYVHKCYLSLTYFFIIILSYYCCTRGTL
jgi:hypothetical protein